jgi:cytochrome c oxidase cbb3-type subunit I/II
VAIFSNPRVGAGDFAQRRQTGPLPETDYNLVRYHVYASMVTVLISALFGILVAIKFSFPEFLGGHAWETWGRLRYNHTQGIFFGWLGNAFIAFFYYVIPRQTNRPVTSHKLGVALFWLWNFAVVLPGWTLVLMGFSQPLEWAEFPLIVDIFVVAAFLIMLVQFVRPFLRVPAGELYVSGWYVVGGLVFTTLAYPIGNLVPQLVPGAKGAAFSGLWIHDAVGLFVTPFALSMAYHVIPAATRRPIYSHFLSMVGFWLLFFIYPLNGTHHYVYSAIPMSAQRGAIMASVYLGFDVILVVTNLLLSLRGSAGEVGSNIGLRFVWVGVVAYLVVSLQGAVQALMPVNRFIHFSDWVIGHSHLAMIGFASFTAAGALAHIWKRIPGVRFNERALQWSFWLLSIGLGLMVIDLTAAGLVEGQLWVSRTPWIDSDRAAYPFWLTRTFTGFPILAGFALFWVGLVTGPRNRSIETSTATAVTSRAAYPNNDQPDAHNSPSILNHAFTVAFVAGFGFFVLSFVALGIIPAMQLQAEINRTAPKTMQPLSAAEERGRTIYGREGCAYCHTEQVRSVASDMQRFGVPTAAWETQYDYPQLWGTRRIGPDLAREHGLRSDDWQFTHLFNPRSVVPDSIMPGYSWMFHGGGDKPSRDALDLVAYLRSLGRERELAGASGNQQPDHAMEMTMNADYNPHDLPDTRTRITSMGLDPAAPVFAMAQTSDPGSLAHGQNVFQHNCAGCHGERADGTGPAARGLLPKPVNLRLEHFSDAHLATVLWDGVYGSSMPAWRAWDGRDLQDVARYVQSIQKQVISVSVSPANLASAQGIYKADCVSCHGESGRGDGPAAGALKPSPVDFHVRQPSMARAWAVLNDGIPGTAMPAWKNRIPQEQLRLLVPYIQQMYNNDKGPTRP